MSEPDAELLRDTVARRHALLTRIGADGVRKRELIDDLGISRSTVDRGVRELEGVGLIERDGGRVHRTLAGTVALEVHDRLMRRFHGIVEAERMLAELPADAPFDPAVLEDATVVYPDTTSQFRPMSCLDNLVRSSDRVRLYSQGLCAPQVETFRESVVGNGLTATVVVTDAVLDRLVTDFADAVLETLETGRVDLYRTDEQFPYSVVVGDTDDGPAMAIGLYTAGGMVGYVGNDSPEAVAWAREHLNDRIAGATRIDTDDI